ncbi:MAG: VIT family protein [Candidatus Microsaccharimonas sp.]
MTTSPSHNEPHAINVSKKSNWLRAAVLGANDGIVSTAGLVVGVAGATDSKLIILTAGLAGIIAGALSMAAGEYVSVSTQRDIEKSLLEKERKELKDSPEYELAELASLYQAKGLSKQTALLVAKELTKKDAFAAHVDAELHIDPNDLTNPWSAAYASAASFLVGALIPVAVIMLPLGILTIPVTFGSVVVALVITGFLSAKTGGSNIRKSIIRVVIGGIAAMAITYIIGRLFNVSGI